MVFLGGLVLALALNAYAVLRFSVGREGEAVVSTIRLEMKLANMAVVAVSSSLLVTLVDYVFLENLTLRWDEVGEYRQEKGWVARCPTLNGTIGPCAFQSASTKRYSWCTRPNSGSGTLRI